MIKKWLFRLLLALLLVSSFSIFGLQQNNSGNKVTKVFKQILTGGMVGVAYAIAPDYLFDGVADDVQAQQMLNDLPTTGGKMILYAGHYSFTATVSRAVDNVTVAGSGAGTYISYNNSTAVFSAGTRTGWIFEDLSTDNGGITQASDTVLSNIWIGIAFYAHNKISSSSGNVTGNFTVSGNITVSGNSSKGLTITGLPSVTADNILIADNGTFYALRTDDGTIMASGTDGAVVLNSMLSALSLVYPNPLYDRKNAPNAFKEGRRVVVLTPEIVTTTQLVIPPNQDFILDMGHMVFDYTGSSSAITIDSSMNSDIHLPIISSHGSTTNATYVNPHTAGPDGLTVFTATHLYVEAVVGAGNGLVVDGASGGIGNNTIIVNEANLDSGDAVVIPSPGANLVIDNNISVNYPNAVANVLNISSASTNVYNNIFNLNMRKTGGTNATIADGSDGLNTILTNPPSAVYAISSANQTVAQGAWYNITNLTTERRDSLGEWNGATATFTALVSGWYQAEVQIQLYYASNITGAVGLRLEGFSDTYAYAQAYHYAPGNITDVFLTCSGYFYMDAGATLRPETYHSQGVSYIIVNGSDGSTHFSIRKVS